MISSTRNPRDKGFMAILGLVIVNVVWLLLMPWVPSIAQATMNRFHLRTSSFAAWAIQQPIPSMYNFANRYEVNEFPPGMVDPILFEGEKRYINHFPTRAFTFANKRVMYLGKGEDRWFTLESSYRGQTLESRFHLKSENDAFTLIRLPQGKVDP
ncbi:MAG: hypothetical protein AB8B91_04915 [Rubripirellula sp.]